MGLETRRRGPLQTLKKRSEFQRIRGGGRAQTLAFIMEGKARPPTGTDSYPSSATVSPSTLDGPRFGFTITKKLGNAVVRNKMRRRLKAALVELVDALARTDMDYVIVARSRAYDQDFASLKSDLADALRRVNAVVAKGQGTGRGAKGPPNPGSGPNR